LDGNSQPSLRDPHRIRRRPSTLSLNGTSLTAQALRSGRGLIGDTAGDVVREIRRSFSGAGVDSGEADHDDSAQARIVDNQPGTEKGKSQ